jgi:hypothetical protein
VKPGDELLGDVAAVEMIKQIKEPVIKRSGFVTRKAAASRTMRSMDLWQ